MLQTEKQLENVGVKESSSYWLFQRSRSLPWPGTRGDGTREISLAEKQFRL